MPKPTPAVPDLSQADETAARELFSAAARVSRHHAEKSEARRAALAGEPAAPPASERAEQPASTTEG